jgi:polynucleotide 5'-hydroxyl-kinase GRC3/NOL9
VDLLDRGIKPEPEWSKLVSGLVTGTVMIIGGPDTGKSTLARYMLREFLGRNFRVGFVDADIGQSSIALPTTIALKVFEQKKQLRDARPDLLLFAGSSTPVRKISYVVEGTRDMVRRAKKLSAEVVIVDTTGLVKGEAGKSLKLGKINAIRPRHVIAIESRDELHHILPRIHGVILHRLKPAAAVRSRSREERTRYREERLAEYFTGSSRVEFPFRDTRFFRGNRPFDGNFSLVIPGTLVGLNRSQITLGLGVYQGVESGRVSIWSPLESTDTVDRVLLGDLILDPTTFAGAH